jgi:hypothetical protein
MYSTARAGGLRLAMECCCACCCWQKWVSYLIVRRCLNAGRNQGVDALLALPCPAADGQAHSWAEG